MLDSHIFAADTCRHEHGYSLPVIEFKFPPHMSQYISYSAKECGVGQHAARATCWKNLLLLLYKNHNLPCPYFTTKLPLLTPHTRRFSMQSRVTTIPEFFHSGFECNAILANIMCRHHCQNRALRKQSYTRRTQSVCCAPICVLPHTNSNNKRKHLSFRTQNCTSASSPT